MSNKKYNKQAVMHLLRSYAEFQKKLMKLADSGLNPFGGWNDFTAATVTLDKAQELVKYAKHYQIVDRDTLKVVQFKHED